MSQPVYRLELVVTNEGVPFYPAVGTKEYPSQDNAGYDLKVVLDQAPTSIATLVGLGVKGRMIRKITYDGGVVLEEDSHFSLEPRSSIFKSGFMMANSRGIIDRSYRGELKAPVISVGSLNKSMEAGTRLFQVIAPEMGFIEEVHYVESLPETKRGAGGFGSTGLK